MQTPDKKADNKPLNTMDTLSEVMSELRKRGYDTDFDMKKDCISCHKDGEELHIEPQNFEVKDIYRFEGATNPSDNSILYAIESGKHELKGVLVGAYGVYADEMNEEMIKKFS